MVSGTLEFGAGSRLEVRALKPPMIIVQGKLIATGEKRRLVLLGAGKMRRGQWKGISGDGQVKLAWARIQCAETGITMRKGGRLALDSVVIRYCGQGISAHGNIELSNCLIARNFGDGLYFVSGGVVLCRGSVLCNDGWGVRTGHYPKFTLTKCSIIGNTKGGLRLSSREGEDPSCEASECNIYGNGSVDVSNQDRGRTVILDGCYLGRATTSEIRRKGEEANLTRIIDLYDGAVAPVRLRNTSASKIAEAGCSLDTSWIGKKK